LTCSASRSTVFDGPGVTAAADRAAAGSGDGPLAEPWRTYAAAVRDTPDQITDADVGWASRSASSCARDSCEPTRPREIPHGDQLGPSRERLRAHHSEDAIFEITTAAAVGAALRSLEAGLRA